MVRRLARDIGRDHPGGVVVVAVLKAGVILAADLLRDLARLDIDVRLDFVETSSFRVDSGRIRLVQDLRDDIGGQPVVLVTTLVDTGFRIAYLLRQFEAQQPSSLRVAALFDKVDRRILPIELDYVGAVVPDRFIVGYGLDAGGHGRHAAAVATLADETVGEPDALARWMTASRGHAVSRPGSDG